MNEIPNYNLCVSHFAIQNIFSCSLLILKLPIAWYEREIYWSKSIKANGRNKVSGGEYILWEN